MRGVFVAGTDTGVGKTRVTCALLAALRRRGIRAAGMKPVATGVSGEILPSQAGEGAAIDDDGAMIASVSTPTCAPPDLNLYRFQPAVSPHLAAAAAGRTIEPTAITAAYQRLGHCCDAVIVEGTGGWLAPIDATRTMADIALSLDLPVLLVVGIRLGCLNHALLSQLAILASGLPLVGWIGSVIDPTMAALAENLATLDARLHAPRLALLAHSLGRDADVDAVGGAVERLFK